MPGRQSFARIIATRARISPRQVVVSSDHEKVCLRAAELDAATDHPHPHTIRNPAGKVRRSAFAAARPTSITG
jgi:hypothetical protein